MSLAALALIGFSLLAATLLLFAQWTGYAMAAMIGIWAMHRVCTSGRFHACTAGMLFHLEHHLFPTVPTCHLPMLAERLDAVGHVALPAAMGGVLRPERPHRL